LSDVQDKIAVGISMPRNIVKKLDNDRGDIPRSMYQIRILEKQYLEIDLKKDLLNRRIETTQLSKPSSD